MLDDALGAREEGKGKKKIKKSNPLFGTEHWSRAACGQRLLSRLLLLGRVFPRQQVLVFVFLFLLAFPPRR